MSRPRYNWWQYVKNVIRAYPELKREYDALHEQAVTANVSGMPGGGSAGRGVESVALRELPKPKQREYDAVRKTIAITERIKTGKDRIRMIDMVFWKKSHTLTGAAMALNLSYETAVEYHRDFIMLTAFHRELITPEELTGIQKLALKSQNNAVK